MAKFRFVWRKNIPGKPSGRWMEKHITASSAAQAVGKMNAHVAAHLHGTSSAELDHLFFEIGAGGLHGKDRKDYTLLAQFAGAGREFILPPELCCTVAL